MLASDFGANCAESTGGFTRGDGWSEVGEDALAVFASQRVPVRTGFAPSGDRTSLLPRVQSRLPRPPSLDTADQRGPILPELLALGRIGLGGNRGLDGDQRTLGATFAPGFRCVVSDGIVSGRGHGRLGLGRCPPSFGSHDRGVVAVIPDGMRARLRQLRDHARQELELVDPLDVIPDIIPAIVLTPTLVGMPAAFR